MKYVLFYEASEDFRSKVFAHVEAHRALWQKFYAEGTLLMIGPFTDLPAGSAMGIFKSRDAAERFASVDPFVAYGIVARWTIREWDEVLVPYAV
ncbi:MAG: YciI family protein [Polyangiaceae bacterium]|nr:YciI family protein [Polyangiaceae bacterium]